MKWTASLFNAADSANFSQIGHQDQCGKACGIGDEETSCPVRRLPKYRGIQKISEYIDNDDREGETGINPWWLAGIGNIGLNLYFFSLSSIKPQLESAMLLLLLSSFSHVRLCGIPEMAAHQAPPSLGFSRQEHWSGLPFPSPMHESEKWKWSRSVVSNS